MQSAKYSEIIERLLIATNSKNESDLAKSLNISSQSVSQAKKKNRIPAQWFTKISQNFEVTMDWLLSGHDPKNLVKNTDIANISNLKITIINLEKEIELLKEINTTQKETINSYKLVLDALHRKEK